MHPPRPNRTTNNSNTSALAAFAFITFAAINFAAHFRLLQLFYPPAEVPVANNRIRHQASSTGAIMTKSYEEYVKEDYRAFVFATHPAQGMLLLYCNRKKSKPPHFQAPGGHVDEEDFVTSHHEGKNEGPALLTHACKIGAARELYEETGIDIRSELDRLQPVRLRENTDKSLFCELKKRLFFKLCLEDSDFVTTGFESKVSMGLSQSMNKKPPPLMLKLSHEHQGFTFEPDASKAVDLLIEHSGGKVSKALRMAIERDDIISVQKVNVHDADATDDSKIVGNPMEGERGQFSEKKGPFDCFNCC